MKGLSGIALVVSKLLEILHWLAAAVMAFMFIASVAAREWMRNILSEGVPEFGRNMKTGDFELVATGADGSINMTAVIIFSVGAVILLSLMAMVFRNVYLIMKTMKGKTWFSTGNTPFQKDIIRMVREIGIFCIAGPVVSFLMGIIARLILGVDAVESSVDLQGFIIGILVLCLSQIFAYGKQLQDDVDGLL